MTFMKKEVVHEEAERYGIDLVGLTWAEQNKLVREAIEADGRVVNSDGTVKDTEPEATKAEHDDAYVKHLEAVVASMQDTIDRLTAKEQEANKEPEPQIETMPQGTVLLSPEIRATNIQLLKYDEELGEDVNVEEVSYKDKMYEGAHVERDLILGTYRIKGKTGRKVVAQSTVPKESAGITYNPETDLVPVVTYNGQRGYIWTHQHYPNIKELLKESGAYHKYKHLFKASEHPENIWYAAGKMMVVSIDTVHAVFREIEDDYRAGKL